MKEQKRKAINNNSLEINNKKKCAKKSVSETVNKKENKNKKISGEKSGEKTVGKKRGPRSGFLNDMVNDRVKKIFSESNIPYKLENGKMIYLDNNNDLNFIKQDIKNDYNISEKSSSSNSSDSGESSNKDEKSVKEMNIEKLFDYYNNILKTLEKNENENDSSHSVLSFDELDSLDIKTDFHFNDTDNIKIADQDLIEITSDLNLNVIHLDLKLLTDFFNYAHTYAPIINPTALVLRIRQRILSPGLLLAIYALTFLFRPNQNKRLAKFYAEKSLQYLFAHIYTSDIQNVHTAYLLSNFEPGTNKSYILSGLSVRLLKVLNLYEDPKSYIETVLYEERVKTIWSCLGKDTLMNITCNRLRHPEWLDQPIPQAITDLSILKYYTPERLSVVFMASVMCLSKVIKHARNRRYNKLDKSEFKRLIDELNTIHKHLESHISLSKISVTTDTHPQLTCIMYHYIMYFTSKLLLFNIELSPYIYHNKLLPSKKYIQIERKSYNITKLIKNCVDDAIKNEAENKLCIENDSNNNDINMMTPVSLASSISSSNSSSNGSNKNKNNDNMDRNSVNSSENDNENDIEMDNMNINNSSINNNNSDSNSNLCINKNNKLDHYLNDNYNLFTEITLSESAASLEYDYTNKCVISKLPEPSYNYKLYENDKETSDLDQKEKDKFIELPSFSNEDIDFENCYNVCFETAEKATNAIKMLYGVFSKGNVKYQNTLCWSFYHLGLFYMNVYANFKKENLKERIEFYHDQIKAMYKLYPFLSIHYSKLYEEAKEEAYQAFLDDSIIFYPKGYF